MQESNLKIHKKDKQKQKTQDTKLTTLSLKYWLLILKNQITEI